MLDEGGDGNENMIKEDSSWNSSWEIFREFWLPSRMDVNSLKSSSELMTLRG